MRSLYRCGVVLAAMAATSVGAGVAVAAPVSFNAVSQFSNSKNPNGVWSYRAAGALDTQNVGDCSANSELFCWTNGLQIPDADVVAVNRTGHTLYFPDDAPSSVALPSGWIELDPESIASSDVQFTAPVTGSYLVYGTFQGVDGSVAAQDAGHPVEVTHNATSVYSAMITVPRQLDSFHLNVPAKAGDTISFQADTSPTTFSYLSTGLQATVTLTSSHCRVPAVRGLTLSVATRRLRAAGCTPGTITRRANARQVISQHPRSGTILPTSSKVNLTLGSRNA